MSILDSLKSVAQSRVPCIWTVPIALAFLFCGAYFYSGSSHPPEMVQAPFPRDGGSYYATEKATEIMFNNAGKPTCNDFFTVFTAGVGAAAKESCLKPFKELSDRFEVWNDQMRSLNSTMYVYTNFHDGHMCQFSGYPNLKMVNFDTDALFAKFNMTEALATMKAWPGRPTRVADVMRLLLAREYHRTYIDMDILLIDAHRSHYMHPFAGAAIFQDNKNALEITNSAFCLPSSILERMIAFVDRRIRLGSNNYFYTELGPSMFHKVLFNQYPAVSLFSQNHPAVADLDRLAREALIYNHRTIHLSGHVRKGHPEYTYRELALATKEKLVSANSQLKR